jgi:hypothetical protein
MSKIKSVYRIHHKNWFWHGPYQYAKMLKAGGHDELLNLLETKECWYEKRPQYIHLMKKLSNHSTFIKNGCFTCWDAQRPGPWDDGLLKHNLRTRGIDRFNLDKKHLFFGFDSMEQLKKWFNDPKEWELFDKYGLIISRLRVRADKVIYGDRQVLVIK